MAQALHPLDCGIIGIFYRAIRISRLIPLAPPDTFAAQRARKAQI
jgi:hypothetical protein